jgi:hypothetical protein
LLKSWLDLSTAQRQTMRQNALPCFEKHFELTRATQQLIEALAVAASDDPIEWTFHGGLLRPM